MSEAKYPPEIYDKALELTKNVGTLQPQKPLTFPIIVDDFSFRFPYFTKEKIPIVRPKLEDGKYYFTVIVFPFNDITYKYGNFINKYGKFYQSADGKYDYRQLYGDFYQSVDARGYGIDYDFDGLKHLNGTFITHEFINNLRIELDASIKEDEDKNKSGTQNVAPSESSALVPSPQPPAVTTPSRKKPPNKNKLERVTSPKIDREEERYQEEIQEEEYEKQLKDLIPKEKVKEIYKTIHTALQDEGKIVQIYNENMEPVATANSKAQALKLLVDLLRKDVGLSEGEKKVHHVGNRLGKNFIMTELRKTKDNKPELYSTYISLLNNYDIRTEKGKRMIYKLKDLYERGFSSDDLRQFAKEALEEKIQRPYDIDTVGKKRVKAKKYDKKDISKMRKYAKKYFA